MNKLSQLPSGWRIARFDEICDKVDRKIILDDLATYSRVGVRWYGLGAFVRDTVEGFEIKRKQQWILKKGDIVYNKLFAWRGSFAIADKPVDGHIVSDKFPTYKADTNVLDLDYLKYYFRTPQLAKQAENLSKGAAAISKLTLNPPQFWDLEIPLPPLDEQRRIVARIEELAAKVEQAQRLRQKSVAEVEALIVSGIKKVLSDASIDGLLGDVLLEKPRNGWSPQCDNAEGGIPVLTLSAVTGFKYKENEFKRTSLPTSPDAHYWVQEGDLLITRSNTPELVGHAAIYNGQPSPCIYSDLMMKVVVDKKLADIQFIHWWLRSIPTRDYIARSAKGTSPTMKKISQKTVMNVPFPSHLSLSQQRRIVAYLDNLQAKVEAVKHHQAATAARLDALLPSILDKAFKGEL